MNSSFPELQVRSLVCGQLSQHHAIEVSRTKADIPLQRGGPATVSVVPSSHTRLASPEVVDRGLAESVSKTIYWSGDFQESFFLFDPSLTSGMSVVLMWGHCLRHRPYIKQHMSAGRVAHRKCRRHRPPHLTRLVREGWINVDPTSQTAGQH